MYVKELFKLHFLSTNYLQIFFIQKYIRQDLYKYKKNILYLHNLLANQFAQKRNKKKSILL